MANVLGTLFQEIANAIRTQTGETETLKPNEFAAEILSIVGSGGVAVGDSTEFKVTMGNFKASELESQVTQKIAHGLGVSPDLVFVYISGRPSNADGNGYDDIDFSLLPLIFCYGTSSRLDEYFRGAGVLFYGNYLLNCNVGMDKSINEDVLVNYIPRIRTYGSKDYFYFGQPTTSDQLHLLAPNCTYTWVALSGMAGVTYAEESDIVKYVTFMSEDGTTELFKMPVISGDDCKEPIAHGDIETPTKESTNTQHFTYSGWSAESGGSADASVLENITEDKVVYASFVASVRYYTVNFYDDDNVTLLHTAQVTYGADATNVFLPEKDGYKLTEWIPSVANITEDTDTYAVWEESLTLAAASWETIAEKSADGTASQLWKVGDEKILTLNDGSQVPVVIVGFNHDDLSDGSGKAGITFAFAKGVHTYHNLISNYGWNEENAIQWLQPQYNIQKYMNENLPVELVNHIKTVKKKWYNPKDTTIWETNNDTLWLFSCCEIGLTEYSNNLSGEGEPYEYFTAGKKQINTAYEELIRYNLDGEPINWYLRTTNTKYTNTILYYIYVDRTGKLISTKSVGQDTYVVPGFCI